MNSRSKKPFRLLDLPARPLHRILVQFDFFELALCSRKTTKAISKLKFNVEEFVIKHLEGRHGFDLRILPSVYISWYFEDVCAVKEPYEFRDKYRIDGVDFPTRAKSDPNPRYYERIGKDSVSLYDSSKLKPGYRPFQQTFNLPKLSNESQVYTSNKFPTSLSGARVPKCWTSGVSSDYDKAINCFVKFITNVFKCEITGYHVDPRGIPDFRQFFMKNVVNGPCKTFELSGVKVDNYQNTIIDPCTLRKVLMNTPHNVKLIVNYGIVGGNDFQFNESLKQKSIHFNVNNMEWFSRYHLFNSKFNELQIDSDYHQLKTVHFQDFVWNWVNGTNEEFRFLNIAVSSEETHHLKANIFGKVEAKDYDKKRKLENFEHGPLHDIFKWNEKIDYSTMKDVQRNDGMDATIYIIGDKNSIGTFIFNVWHRKQKKHQKKSK